MPNLGLQKWKSYKKTSHIDSSISKKSKNSLWRMQPETYKRSGFLAIKGKEERKEEEDELNLEEVRQEGF